MKIKGYFSGIMFIDNRFSITISGLCTQAQKGPLTKQFRNARLVEITSVKRKPKAKKEKKK